MLDLHSKNTIIFSEIAQQKSHSSKFPQNATKCIVLFVPAEIDENNYFDTLMILSHSGENHSVNFTPSILQ